MPQNLRVAATFDEAPSPQGGQEMQARGSSVSIGRSSESGESDESSANDDGGSTENGHGAGRESEASARTQGVAAGAAGTSASGHPCYDIQYTLSAAQLRGLKLNLETADRVQRHGIAGSTASFQAAQIKEDTPLDAREVTVAGGGGGRERGPRGSHRSVAQR